MEEISNRQKSRCLWLKEGDRNTIFFHHMANIHRRGNQIEHITVDGICLNMEDEVREGVADFYRRLFQDGGGMGWRLGVDDLVLEVLSEEERVLLERPFSEEKVGWGY